MTNANGPRTSFSKPIANRFNKNRKVIVVGGGLAGIAAAISLSECGYRVTLVEAKSRLGGRVGSFDDVSSGQPIDYCQHVGMSCCTNFVEFLKLLSIEKEWKKQETLHFFSKHGVHLPLRGAPLPAPMHLSGLLLKWPELGWNDRIQIAWGLFRLMRLKPVVDHDEALAIDWLRSIGQKPSAIANFWATILVSALGEQIDRVTLGAARKVLIDGFATNRSGYHLLVPQQRLSSLIGSSAIAKLEASGAVIQLSSPVKGLRWKESVCQGVELSDGSVLNADSVVVAVPWHQVDRLFLDHRMDAPETVRLWLDRPCTLESSPITGVHTWWDKPWLDQPHAILIDRLCQWVFEHPAAQLERSNEYYYQIVISGSRQLPRGRQQATLDAVVEDLRAIFPKAVVANLLRGKVVTDPNAVFSVAKGALKARPRVDLFAENRLWLCGDWTNTGWPATMEGAIRSGFAVTESVTQRDGEMQPWLAKDLARGWLSRVLIRG